MAVSGTLSLVPLTNHTLSGYTAVGARRSRACFGRSQGYGAGRWQLRRSKRLAESWGQGRITKGTSPSQLRVFCGSPEDEVCGWIKENMGTSVKSVKNAGASGWSSCAIFETEGGEQFFGKVSRGGPGAVEMFTGEAEGLKALAYPNCMRIPRINGYGELPGGGAFILMEYLKFSGRASDESLGTALAQLHLTAPPETSPAHQGKFGFQVKNTIGGTPQPNKWMDDWVEFLRDERLAHQLRLARDPELSRLGDKLLANLGDYFEDVIVTPSILHGDLWSGNITAVDGQPAIFDPAAYYGHHEAEFGMSWCAGFSSRFWGAYHDIIPRAPGFAERKKIYELYHYLNHYNLFGGGYRSTARSLLVDLV